MAKYFNPFSKWINLAFYEVNDDVFKHRALCILVSHESKILPLSLFYAAHFRRHEELITTIFYAGHPKMIS
jgi:hypothetical protein